MAEYEFKDTGLAEFLRNIVFLEKTQARVGVIGARAHQVAGSGGMSVGEVAHINEFGGTNVPQRSFTRKALKDPKATKLLEDLARSAIGLGLNNLDAAYRAAGEGLAEIMREIVANGDTRANKQSTIVRKGFNHPLFETGTLLDSISSELVRVGTE